MAIKSREIDYHEFSQDVFKGKEIYNRHDGRVLQKWESYHICKDFWDLVAENIHTDWACRDKDGYSDGVYTGRVLKAIKKFWTSKKDKK